jgi:peptidoglycan-N-acetylglucosamine deacetylase
MRLLILLLFPMFLRAQSLALSFDDGFDPRKQAMAPQWNAEILGALAKARIQAILFPAGRNVDSREGLNLVRAWGHAGHRVGNHTYNHLNLGSPRLALETFEADVLKNEPLLKGMPGWISRFRFPYLKEGGTAIKRDGFRNWLSSHGYQPGSVSIDASDWYYNARFLAWREAHPKEDTSGFRKAYLQHLWDRATYYDGLSRKVLGRSAKHVLLLHTNAINAAFLPDVIEMFRSRGWTFVSSEEAFADPLYKMKPDVLPAGEGILWALAKEKGILGLRYPAEDDVYEKPLLDAMGF